MLFFSIMNVSSSIVEQDYGILDIGQQFLGPRPTHQHALRAHTPESDTGCCNGLRDEVDRRCANK